jgi:hypothetical protein
MLESIIRAYLGQTKDHAKSLSERVDLLGILTDEELDYLYR